MNAALHDPGVDWRLDYHAELPSTSDFCAAQAKAGAAAGLAVMAGKQTAGRGSRGRAWVAPAGNLNVSFLLRPALPAAEAGVFALLAGLAAAEALTPVLPRGKMITLKWPNDLLLEGAKLGGVLIDASPSGTALDWLVIGIGVNLQTAPQIPGRATTSLAAHGADLAADSACAAVLERLKARLATLAASGVEPIHQAWLRRAHQIGTKLDVHTGQKTWSGQFAGLSRTGELLLQTEHRIERISTGDIMLRGGAKN